MQQQHRFFNAKRIGGATHSNRNHRDFTFARLARAILFVAAKKGCPGRTGAR